MSEQEYIKACGMEADHQQNNHILIVDDDAVSRIFLQSVLSEQGFQVTAVADFESVQQLMKQHLFCVVLMDLVFVDQDYSGFDILDYVKSVCPHCGVVIITSHPCTDSAVQAVRIRASDYLMKPVKSDDLIATVQNTIMEVAARCPDPCGDEQVKVPVPLSPREHQVLHLLFKGCSYPHIADVMDCSVSTAKTHGKRIYKKLGVHSRSEAIHEAIHLNLIQQSSVG